MVLCTVCGFVIALNGDCLHTALGMSVEQWRRLSLCERTRLLRDAQKSGRPGEQLVLPGLEQEEVR